MYRTIDEAIGSTAAYVASQLHTDDKQAILVALLVICRHLEREPDLRDTIRRELEQLKPVPSAR